MRGVANAPPPITVVVPPGAALPMDRCQPCAPHDPMIPPPPESGPESDLGSDLDSDPGSDPESARESVPRPALSREHRPEDVVESEWIEWYSMTPMERWEASGRLWADYLALGGSLDPEVDTQSPFWSGEELAEFARNTAAARQDRARQPPRTHHDR